ncbi:MAG: hypothetical protein HC930_01835 [Hydrococcus sp. SU_1_0]|nr:hypothetical protein [Hydrococcus sp. SU_1_0]
MLPDRYRSGKKAPPYLLLDKASYVLGVAKSTGDTSSDVFHASFIELLEKAFKDTQDSELELVINFLRQPLPKEILEKINPENKSKKDTSIKPEDLVTIRTKSDEFVFERDCIQKFWINHLAQEYISSSEDSCAICGRKERMLKSLPRSIVVLGQKCQIISLNDDKTAFFSFRRKPKNVFTPICFQCGLKAIDGLDYLIQTEKHRKTLAQDLSKGQSKNPLKNQLAVFWLKELQNKSTQEQEVADIDVEAALSSLLNEEDINCSKGESEQNQASPPELSQLENLLKSPWTGNQSSLYIDDKGFNLAVLSANTGRLVIRDWISISLKDLQTYLSNFLDSTRIISLNQENIRSFFNSDNSKSFGKYRSPTY